MNQKNRTIAKHFQVLLLLCLAFFSSALQFSDTESDLVFDEVKDDLVLRFKVDSSKWESYITILNLSDTTAFIYPRFTSSLVTTRTTPTYRTIELDNFENHSSIQFPVTLSPIKTGDSIVIKGDFSRWKKRVSTFDMIDSVRVTTNLMMDFSDFNFREDSLGCRTIHCNEYQYFSKNTAFVFALK